MLTSRYIFEYIRALLASKNWERRQFRDFFPAAPSLIYQTVEAAGFPAEAYRDFWPDLKSELPSDAYSVRHYINYMDLEVKAPQRLPLHLDFARLRDLTRIKVRDRFYLGSLVRNLVQWQVDSSAESVTNPVFWSEALNALSQVGTPVIAIGDSHSLVLRQTIRAASGPILAVNLLCGGGSAVGLANKNSRSGYGALIQQAHAAVGAAKATLNLGTPIFFTFGQVDSEFVSTYRRLRSRDFAYNGADFDEFCKEAAHRYVGWLASLNARDVVVVGINPPCIDDIHIKQAYLEQMQVYLNAGVADVKDGDSFENLVPIFNQLEFPSKQVRTRNHRLFNEHLRSVTADLVRRPLKCAHPSDRPPLSSQGVGASDRMQKSATFASDALGLAYTDAFDAMIGPDGCIEPRFACASEGGPLQVGGTGTDIHVGGPYALAAKADMIRRFVASAPAHAQ